MTASNVDWGAIEREYRAGQLSIRELGRQFGVSAQGILARAKRSGWTRDLSKNIQRTIKVKLALQDGGRCTDESSASCRGVDTIVDTPTVDTSNARTKPVPESAIVEIASARGVQVIMGHRAGARRGLQIVESLKAELEIATANLHEIELAIDAATADDATRERRKVMLRAVSLPSRVAVIRDLAQAESKYIQIERQAHNLNDNAADQGETYEERLRRLSDLGCPK